MVTKSNYGIHLTPIPLGVNSGDVYHNSSMSSRK